MVQDKDHDYASFSPWLFIRKSRKGKQSVEEVENHWQCLEVEYSEVEVEVGGPYGDPDGRSGVNTHLFLLVFAFSWSSESKARAVPSTQP